MELPQLGERHLVYENPYQKVYKARATFAEFTKEYYVTDFGPRAGLVAVDGDRVLLVRQYRLLIHRLSWEIPGGRVDDGEEPAAAAVRECLEETGIRCANPRPLLFYHTGLDTVYNPTHLFYSDEIAEVHEPQSIHQQEVHSWEWLPLARGLEMIAAGEIQDNFTIAALLAYRVFRSGGG
jgi:8-oxo-dGTP pyrophosphatase MutT (NUDIX family)